MLLMGRMPQASRGRARHLFDYGRRGEGALVVRMAAPGERLTTLDGVERTLDAETLVVADAQRAAGIAGIIGGASTEITPQTRAVVLEAASWHPAMIRRTSRRHGVRTASSARFEASSMTSPRACAASSTWLRTGVP